MGYPLVILISLAYLLLLFAIAYWADRRTSKGKSLVTNPYIYALSLAVYCTAWTYYGSVGRAASSGIGFLPIYLGPTLSAPLWIMLLRKMITISKAQRITSVADFISARYGKSEALGVIATLIAVLGIIPYIALQLKAIVFSFEILSHGASTSATASAHYSSFYYDTAFYVTIVLALFSILFGTRKLEANERHEGMVAAIAFESILKLVAFLSVGIFVTYVLFDGAADIFERVSKLPEISNMFLHDSIGPVNWFVLIFISMTAILMLPRQFHIAVVENQSIGHVNKAMWLFPLYMLIINIFVLPIAAGGLLIFPNGIVEADTFVLDLPLLFGQEWLATFAFIGGLSAGSSMVIVSSIGLSIMISNNLIMPFLLRGPSVKRLSNYDLSDRILNLRRLFIAVVMLLSYGYFKLVGTKYSLVSIGLISFTAVAQFAPAALIGMYWKGATRLGAILGLSSGFIIWAFTLPIPNLVEAGFISQDLMQDGLFGISLLRPHALFGLEGLDPITHAVFWSMFFNLGFFIGGSLYSTSNATAQMQANLFVDVYQYAGQQNQVGLLRRSAKVSDIRMVLNRFLGETRASWLLDEYAMARKLKLNEIQTADEAFVSHAENLLTGAIGSASSRIIMASITQEETLGLEEVMSLLDQTQQIVRYSRELELKSKELERTTQELRSANLRLTQLDELKNDFISTVTHELRTPMTSIKSLSRILLEDDSLDSDKRKSFLSIIVSESERLARLINQVLDVEKLQSDTVEDIPLEPVIINEVVAEAVQSVTQWYRERNIITQLDLSETQIYVHGNIDKLKQVILNLLSNAGKFCPPTNGQVVLRLYKQNDKVRVEVSDNGKGVPPEKRQIIFDRFTQINDQESGKPEGNGLGLFISATIVKAMDGNIWVDESAMGGAKFTVELPELQWIA